MTIGRFLTTETIRLGLFGFAAGSAAGLIWRTAGRTRWGPVPFVLAVFVATRLAGRSDWPRWHAMAVAGVVIALLAGLGTARLLSDLSTAWWWVAAGALVSAGGVWAGVPETGPAVLAGSALGGLSATALFTRSRWAPAGGLGVVATIAWAALAGATGRPWATVGGALCAGVAPWFALRPLLPSQWRARDYGPWLLFAHWALVILAARWIGVNPHAGWPRVLVVVAAGVVVAAVARRRA